MERPLSIVKFDRCYLAAIVIGLLNTALSWPASMEKIQTSGQSPALLIGATLIGFGITIALWYFIARRGSAIAKWIATVFLALALVGLLISLATGNYPKGLSGVIGIVTTTLQAISVWLLFQPDTKAWFGETRGPVA